MNPLVRMFLEDLRDEDTSGKASQEVEHVFYGKVADANQLVELSKLPYVTKVLQEQFEGRLDVGENEGKIGIRLRVRQLNRSDCVITSKTYIAGQIGDREKTLPIPPELFSFLRATFGKGLNKTRYVIQPDGAKKLQFDLFLDAAGQPTGYGKFDYEVSTEDEQCPPLPVTLIDLKHFNPFRATEQDRADLHAFMESQAVRV